MNMQNGPSRSVLASASASQLQKEATCSGQRCNCRHDFAGWPRQVALPFRQPYVNFVLGSSLISIPRERSISKGSPTLFPSLKYASPLNRGTSSPTHRKVGPTSVAAQLAVQLAEGLSDGTSALARETREEDSRGRIDRAAEPFTDSGTPLRICIL